MGFEPTEACTSLHFECSALDHYATSPRLAPSEGFEPPTPALGRRRSIP